MELKIIGTETELAEFLKALGTSKVIANAIVDKPKAVSKAKTKFVDTKFLANKYGLTGQAIRNYVKRGMPHKRIDNSFQYNEADASEWIDNYISTHESKSRGKKYRSKDVSANTIGEDYNVETKVVEKANGVSKTGIVITEMNSKISPTIYVEKGMTAKDIVNIYNKNKNVIDLSISNINDVMNRDYILANVIPVLYNKTECANMLESAVNVTCADLAIAFRVRINDSATFLVRENMLNTYNISEQELYDTAIANIQGKGKVMDIMVMLTGYGMEVDEEMDVPIVVVMNDDKTFAASMILDKEVQAKLDRIFTEGCYVLPSSIHEVIAVSKSNDSSELVNVVKEVNSTVLSREEFLSNSIYEIVDGNLTLVK